MIFEIFGAISFEQAEQPFDAAGLFMNSVDRDPKNRRMDDRVQDLSVTCLTRGDAAESMYKDEHWYTICIGEPRSRGPRSERLTACDIHELHGDRGDDFINGIKGNFQIILYNKDKNTISLINSRFGVSPFYYCCRRGILMFSSNLLVIAGCAQDGRTLDATAIAEYSWFGHPLGNRTLFRDIRSIRPAERITVQRGAVKNEIYWDHRCLTAKTAYRADEALSIGAELFRRTVSAYTGEPDRICLSLTAGFDGRTILAVMPRDPRDFLCYSFGIKGSPNVTVPRQICRSMGFKYLPVWLDQEYERSFDRYALEAVAFSDCLATFERANYPYAFSKLNGFSPVVVTGIFGSELMRTFQNVSVGYMVTRDYIDLIGAADRARMLTCFIERMKASYYDRSLLDAGHEEVIEHVLGECFGRYAGIPEKERFFLFLLNEGARKYFGGEVHMERIYGTNRFPFLDDDFVEYVFRSPFSGVRSNPLKPSVKERFASQYFYARVIQAAMPRLLTFTTDHGYPPRYIVSKTALLKIAPCLVLKRLRQVMGRDRDFDIEAWSDRFYHGRIPAEAEGNGLFSHKLAEDLENGRWKNDRFGFAKAASLMFYLGMAGQHGA